MRFTEHEAASVFERYGIAFPVRQLAADPKAALSAAADIGCPVVIKAQVPAGGRGKAGGVRIAADPGEAARIAGELLRSRINGHTVKQVLVARRIPVVREWYLGVTVDGLRGKPAVVAGPGGMDVEETARTQPGTLARLHTDPLDDGLLPARIQVLMARAAFPEPLLEAAADVLGSLYHAFMETDALTAEINPLAETPEGTFVALDARLETDDAARFRRPSFLPDRAEETGTTGGGRERRAQVIGVSYVELEGDIGIIASGAGLGMATVDIAAARGLRPANFLETGGAITEEQLYNTVRLVLDRPGLRGLLINLYGGINPIHEGAKGIVRALQELKPGIPVVAKALGNRERETWDILRGGGVDVVTDIRTEAAVDRLRELLGEGA